MIFNIYSKEGVEAIKRQLLISPCSSIVQVVGPILTIPDDNTDLPNFAELLPLKRFYLYKLHRKLPLAFHCTNKGNYIIDQSKGQIGGLTREVFRGLDLILVSVLK